MLLIRRSRRANNAVRTASPGGELFVASVVIFMILASFGDAVDPALFGEAGLEFGLFDLGGEFSVLALRHLASAAAPARRRPAGRGLAALRSWRRAGASRSCAPRPAARRQGAPLAPTKRRLASVLPFVGDLSCNRNSFRPPSCRPCFAIVLIDLVLAGDNALIIGLVARNLPQAHATQGHLLGHLRRHRRARPDGRRGGLCPRTCRASCWPARSPWSGSPASC